jgi:ubiquinone/menaquinone biosynthesis C-methylase UbiE
VNAAKVTTVGVFSRAAASYNAVGPRHFTYFAQRLVEYVDVRPGDRVLDVATGTGEVLLAAAQRCGERGQAVGIDLAAPMLERAAAAIRDRDLHTAGVRQMDAERLEFPDASFDIVLSAFGLSSFPTMLPALDECWRVLRPGGRLGLVDSFGWYFDDDDRWHWLKEVLHAFGSLPDGNQTDAQATELPAVLSDVGFTMVEHTEATFDLVFQDEEEWWRWMWSHGTRRLLEAVQSSQRDELKEELFRGLPRSCGDSGMIRGTMRALLVRARKPLQE